MSNRIIKQYSADSTWTAPGGVNRVLVSIFDSRELTQKIRAGFSTSLALGQDGQLWTWGYSGSGELGDSTVVSKSSPVIPSNPWPKFKSVANGAYHYLAIDEQGRCWAWGSGLNGRLGNNAASNQSLPVQVATGVRFKMVAGGQDHSVGIDQDGYLWAWGDNTGYQLGDGTNVAKSTPVRVSSNLKFKFVEAGNSFSLAISEAGNAYAWGSNLDGQLGLGDTTTRSSPVQVTTPAKTWKMLSATLAGTSFFLADDGTLYASGENGSFELGIPGSPNVSTPTQVSGPATWMHISAASNMVLGLDSNGAAWAWGLDLDGEMGVGNVTYTDVSSPSAVIGGHTFIHCNAGDFFYAGLKSDGTMWVWGDSLDGAVGVGSTTIQRSPVQMVGNQRFDTMFDEVFVARRYIDVTPGTSYAITVGAGVVKFGDEIICHNSGYNIMVLDYVK
jgi:alpha-tubulin suppressor-like RCC1 family protein